MQKNPLSYSGTPKNNFFLNRLCVWRERRPSRDLLSARMKKSANQMWAANRFDEAIATCKFPHVRRLTKAATVPNLVSALLNWSQLTYATATILFKLKQTGLSYEASPLRDDRILRIKWKKCLIDFAQKFSSLTNFWLILTSRIDSEAAYDNQEPDNISLSHTHSLTVCIYLTHSRCLSLSLINTIPFSKS